MNCQYCKQPINDKNVGNHNTKAGKICAKAKFEHHKKNVADPNSYFILADFLLGEPKINEDDK